jgi:hypothetical protein
MKAAITAVGRRRAEASLATEVQVIRKASSVGGPLHRAASQVIAASLPPDPCNRFCPIAARNLSGWLDGWPPRMATTHRRPQGLQGWRSTPLRKSDPPSLAGPVLSPYIMGNSSWAIAPAGRSKYRADPSGGCTRRSCELCHTGVMRQLFGNHRFWGRSWPTLPPVLVENSNSNILMV